ncbi:hypothetical protein PMZ80_010694 [Knufia obscura]|uniref:Methyltransferase domain-containing protein n=2 Tax=Knufia TaxID=430999 RepID=A0AAN8IAB3_9EURO|nr:hypothetical protein PMZ80_010694 [Knufia obscura]KAK5955385.1 hypothetical protein OHC33_004068 [Knufia fluminis]
MSNPYSHYPDFYQAEPKHIPDPIATVLETYSHIPRDQQLSHILKVRNRAYEAHPYPCLGRFRFIELDLSSHPLYHDYVLPQLQRPSSDKDSPTPLFLDLGTCLGQDIRKLIFDGADPQHIYGSDIVLDFISAGYDLFKDEDRFPRDHFICPADVFDESEDNNLAVLDGKVDILHATAVFHLFSGEQQFAVAERCFKLLRKTPGSRALVLGAQVGNVKARESVRQDGVKRFRHDEESWRELWEYVCAKEEFRDVVKKVEVSAVLKERKIGDAEQAKHIGSTEEGFRWMVWQVWVEF